MCVCYVVVGVVYRVVGVLRDVSCLRSCMCVLWACMGANGHLPLHSDAYLLLLCMNGLDTGVARERAV